MPDTPFETIESAQEYLRLLASEVQVVRADIDADIAESFRARAGRRVDALRIVDYKLKQLEQQLGGCSRILNDLRMLRRILVSEQETVPVMARRGSDTRRL